LDRGGPAPLKTRFDPTTTCVILPNFVAPCRSNRLGVRGVLKKFGDAGPSSLGMVACLPPRNTQRTQMCYHTKFRIGQTVWAQVGVSPPQKKMESWAPPLGAWLIHYKLNPVPEVLANQISWL